MNDGLSSFPLGARAKLSPAQIILCVSTLLDAARTDFSPQSLSFNSMTLDVHSAEQNIEAACSASCVDKIFKENGGKALVALEK